MRRRAKKAREEHLERALDEALRETFPASDPIAVAITRARRPRRRERVPTAAHR